MKWLLIILGVASLPLLLGMILFTVANSPSANGVTAFNKKISNQYYHDATKVYFVSGGNFFELGEREIPEADLSSFRVLSDAYAKDDNYAYYQGNKIDKADASSFEARQGAKSESIFAIDKNAVFLSDKIIPTADSASFIVIGSGYAKDQSSFFHYDEAFADASDTYAFLGSQWEASYLSIDNHVYRGSKLVPNISANGFEMLANGFFKDNQSVLHGQDEVAGANSETFVIINDWVQKDRNRIYYKGTPLDFGDPQSAEKIDSYYWRDDNHVYIGDKLIEGLNPLWFTPSDVSRYTGYSYQTINLSPNTITYIKKKKLEWISDAYFIYQNKVFHRQGDHLEDSSPHNYKTVSNDKDAWYLISNDHLYYGSDMVQGADIKSFKTLESDSRYGTDDHSVYWVGHVIADADPKTFTLEKGMHPEQGEDGKYRIAAPVIDAETSEWFDTGEPD
ncbi:DKNYY domain-containing protein [Parendozoicomonas haliclonae]|uniref:DKNYY family protein n=1 Tax=Parendozoicomonas haliclonae TaxID=1960125 RepID=A0A1X7AQR8_9GAMM|nr:DKNYY domain-containing protein [Parendozoicomonas haliclonae]SMA50646.1 hypothetical protein EHSB41UT_04463 [Parendozoicomonas haliclonae]